MFEVRHTNRRRALVQLSHLAGGAWLATQTNAFPLHAQPPGRKLKVGQIGTQHAHATKLSVYRNHPDYEVVGIVETDDSARQRAGQQPAFADLPWLSEQELLGTAGLDVVLVETSVRELLPTAQRVVEAGQHVHVDKPAGNDMAAFQHLMDSARSRQRMVQMGYMYRYNPAVLLLQEFLKAGWLGDVYEVHAVIGKTISPRERQELAEFPGGIMFELGCHLIDLVIGVIGAGSRVTAFRQRLGPDGLSDNVLAVFEQPRLLATVKTSALEIEGGSRRHLVVCGTLGTFHIQPLDNPVATISLKEPRGQFKAGTQTKSFPKFVRYIADATDMARVLRGQAINQFPYEHDLEVQRCVLAACGT